MIYIIISVLSIIIGIIAILKNKRPKYEDDPGFAIETNYYFGSYLLVIAGIIYLILKFTRE